MATPARMGALARHSNELRLAFCPPFAQTVKIKIGEGIVFPIHGARIFLLSTGIATGLSDVCYSATPLEEHFKYVADAANQINFLVAKSADPNENAKEIAEQACKMLTQLASDGQFKDLVYKGLSSNLNGNVKETLSDLAKVNDAVDKETQALQAIGVNHLTSIQAIAAAIPLAKTIDLTKISPEKILKDISELKDRSCQLAGEIERTEKREAMKNAIELGVSGVAIAAADGVGAYASAGLAANLVVFSLTLGAGMITVSLDHLSKP